MPNTMPGAGDGVSLDKDTPSNTGMKVELRPEADASPIEDAFCLLDFSRPTAYRQGGLTAAGLFLNQGLQPRCRAARR